MKKLLIKLIAVVLAVFVLILLVSSVHSFYLDLNSRGFFMVKEEKHFHQKLKEFKDSEKETIKLRELTNFEWDHVILFTPYDSYFSKMGEYIELNKFTIKNKENNYLNHISYGECCYNIVFLKINTKTSYIIRGYLSKDGETRLLEIKNNRAPHAKAIEEHFGDNNTYLKKENHRLSLY